LGEKGGFSKGQVTDLLQGNLGTEFLPSLHMAQVNLLQGYPQSTARQSKSQKKFMYEALEVSQMAQNDASTEVIPAHSWKSSGNLCVGRGGGGGEK
jgi:hypothetical protein